MNNKKAIALLESSTFGSIKGAFYYGSDIWYSYLCAVFRCVIPKNYSKIRNSYVGIII